MRIFHPSFSSTLQPTRSCTQTLLSVSRRQEAPRRSAPSGNRSAWPARRPARCSFKPRHNNGKSNRRVAPQRIARSCMPPAGAKYPMAIWLNRQATRRPPKEVPVKDPKDFVLIGKPLKRFDTPGKTDGKVVYGIDAMLPGMKFATIAACPIFGGKVARSTTAPPGKCRACRKSSCSTTRSAWLATICGRRRRGSMR